MNPAHALGTCLEYLKVTLGGRESASHGYLQAGSKAPTPDATSLGSFRNSLRYCIGSVSSIT